MQREQQEPVAVPYGQLKSDSDVIVSTPFCADGSFEKPNERLHTKTIRGLGITQLILGVAVLGLGIANVVYGCPELWHVRSIAAGIWTGVMYIVPGAVGIAATRKKRNVLIIAYMVLCIVAVAMAICGIVFGGRQIRDTKREAREARWNDCKVYDGGDYDYYYNGGRGYRVEYYTRRRRSYDYAPNNATTNTTGYDNGRRSYDEDSNSTMPNVTTESTSRYGKVADTYADYYYDDSDGTGDEYVPAAPVSRERSSYDYDVTRNSTAYGYYNDRRSYNYYNRTRDMERYHNSCMCNQVKTDLSLSVGAILIISSAVELIIAIVSSVLCCLAILLHFCTCFTDTANDDLGNSSGYRKPNVRVRSSTLHGLGVTQVILGVVTLGLGIADVVYGCGDTWRVRSIATGIWAGVVYILSGSFGIAVAKKRFNSLVITYMAFSVVAFALAICAVVFGAREIKTTKREDSSDDCSDGRVRLGYAVGAILIICAVAEIVITIISNVFCCYAIWPFCTTCFAATPKTNEETDSGDSSGHRQKPNEHLHSNSVGCLGITQVVLGFITIVFAIADVSYGCKETWDVRSILVGIWTGALYILTGSFGIAAAKKRIRFLIITYMILSGVAFAMAICALVFGAREIKDVGGLNQKRREYRWDEHPKECHNGHTKMGNVVGAILVICAMAEIVITILSNVLCTYAIWPSCACCAGCTAAPNKYLGRAVSPSVNDVPSGTGTTKVVHLCTCICPPFANKLLPAQLDEPVAVPQQSIQDQGASTDPDCPPLYQGKEVV